MLFLTWAATVAMVAASAFSSPSLKEIAASQAWKKLLHYKPATLLRKERSAVSKGPPFFLSSDGDRDAVAELNASIEAFESSKRYSNIPVSCLLPARKVSSSSACWERHSSAKNAKSSRSL